jgi:hypothetical protein
VLLRQIYEVNRQTIEEGRTGPIKAILIPLDTQQDAREAGHLAEKLMMAGVEIYRAESPFQLDEGSYATGTLVIPMTQVFARYAKDLLEKQTYPEVRRTPDSAPEPPYDVTAWSLGMLFGVQVNFARSSLPPMKLTRLGVAPMPEGRISGNGPRFLFEYTGPDTAIAINRMLRAGLRVSFEAPSRVVVEDAAREALEPHARDFGLVIVSDDALPPNVPRTATRLRAPRIAVYAPYTSLGGNVDEGWTRWVLEQHEFNVTVIHNSDIRQNNLRQQFDVVILADQPQREIIDGMTGNNVRPEYRGGIGDSGVDALNRFVMQGGTLVALCAASYLFVYRFPIPLRNL